jgi:hypothetical protein
MLDCRANNLPGWTQRGWLSFFSTCHFSGALTRDNDDRVGFSGDAIVRHFAINYHNEAAALGINLEELYAAQIADVEVFPPEWNIQGRQSNVYK